MLAGDALPLRLEAGIPIGDAVITEVVTGAVDLNLLFRHVKLADIDAKAPDGPWPHEAVASQVVQPGGGAIPDVNILITEGLSSAPGEGEVEAWASTISGTIPLGFREIEDSVQIDYRWKITGTDPEGNPLPADHLAVIDGSPTAAALTLVARPILDAMREEGELGDSTLCVQAEVRVRLAVTGADSGWVKIPPEPVCIALAPLKVPEVGALFRNPDFAGNAVFLTVPAGSAMDGPGELLSVVGNLRSVVERLEQAAALTAWAAGIGGLVGAIRQLATRLPTVPHVGFRRGDEHNDLGKYNFIPVDWQPWDDDFEDRASSALAITVNQFPAFYQHDNQGGERLAIDARPTRAGQLGGATIANLHVNTPASAPPGAVRRSGAPSGGWGDVISSYRWETQ